MIIKYTSFHVYLNPFPIISPSSFEYPKNKKMFKAQCSSLENRKQTCIFSYCYEDECSTPHLTPGAQQVLYFELLQTEEAGLEVKKMNLGAARCGFQLPLSSMMVDEILSLLHSWNGQQLLETSGCEDSVGALYMVVTVIA